MSQPAGRIASQEEAGHRLSACKMCLREAHPPAAARRHLRASSAPSQSKSSRGQQSVSAGTFSGGVSLTWGIRSRLLPRKTWKLPPWVQTGVVGMSCGARVRRYGWGRPAPVIQTRALTLLPLPRPTPRVAWPGRVPRGSRACCHEARPRPPAPQGRCSSCSRRRLWTSPGWACGRTERSCTRA